MTSVLIVDGKEFVTATSAGKHFGYSKDYILLLIKGGKIEGRKIVHKWYVYMPTAEVYFRTAEKDRDAQRKAMSTLRKEELKHHTRARVKNHHRTALIETLVIVIIGLSLGATGYLGTTSQVTAIHESGQAYNALERLAIALHTFISPKESLPVFTPDSSPNGNTDSVLGSVIESEISTTTEYGLIIAPEDMFATTSIESIQDAFSDPVQVSVDESNSKTGLITPIFKNSESEAYRFLMVPVTKNP